MAKRQTAVRSFRLTIDDWKEFDKFKKSVVKEWGEVNDTQALRIMVRKINRMGGDANAAEKRLQL